jgi:NAD(P)-dependent dehydrogenase (short-subunit alcohol dehydrogenase family)
MPNVLTRLWGAVARLLAFSLVLLTCLVVSEQALAENGQRAVFVTGASTGIGRKITERLAADGYFVYAGARKEEDLRTLNAITNVQAIRLDVTQDEEIAGAVRTVSKAGRGLYGLVNNAGVVTLGSLTGTSQDEFGLVMAVNVNGPFRITKAFAPMIIASKGRIVTIGSNAGVLAIKNMGAYCMSKHAIEAFTDVLDQEMQPYGVQVSIIEPGGYQSEIFNSAARRAGRKPAPSSYSPLPDPIEVAIATERALFEPQPKRRYLVVATEPEAEATVKKQIEQLIELNEGHHYTYDRETLIRMLDKALAGSRGKTQ